MISYERLQWIKRHEARTAFDASQQRRMRRAQRQTVQPPTFERLVDPEFLLQVGKRLQREGGLAPGPDGVTWSDLNPPTLAAFARELARQLRDGSWRPSPARHVRIPKNLERTDWRELQVRSIITRWVAAALDEQLQPLWQGVLSDTVHGFRQQRGPHTLWLALEQHAHAGRAVVAQDDIRKAFDEVPIGRTLTVHRHYIEEDNLLGVIERVLRGNPIGETGIDQGSPYSPAALNLLLHQALDGPIRRPAAPPFLRYADNLVWPCRSVPEGAEAIRKAQELLEEIGMRLKGGSDLVRDLRETGVNVLGLKLHLDGKIKYRIPEETCEELGEMLRECHLHANPPEAAEAVIRGWLQWVGPALESDRGEVAERLVRKARLFGFDVPNIGNVRRMLQSARDRWRHRRERAVTMASPETDLPDRRGCASGAPETAEQICEVF